METAIQTVELALLLVLMLGAVAVGLARLAMAMFFD